MFNVKKRVIASIVGASLLATSVPSNALLLPITDYTQLGQSIVNSAMELEYSELKIAIKKEMMEQAASFAEVSIDNDNNVWSNVIVRQGAALEEIQNIEVTQWVTPAFNTVKTLGMSIGIYCNEGGEVFDKESADKDYVSAEEAAEIEDAGGTATSFEDVQDDIIERFNGGDGVCQSVTDSTTESAINPKPLISDTPDEESLSEDAEQAIYDYIDLVAPPYIASYRDKSRAVDANETLKVKNAEREVINSFPRVLLLKLMSKRSVTYSDTGLSEITTIQEFADQHYGQGTSSNSNISGKIMLSNLAVPSVIWRNVAAMKAFEVHMAVLKFKANLDKLALHAVRLAFAVNKKRLNIENQVNSQ